MAVVFISPKQRQKVFFMGITAVFLLFVVVVASIVFLSQPQQSQVQLVLNKPKINIDFKTLDSDGFKNLAPFSEMELQFTYDARTKEGTPKQGLISAVSTEEAINLLESMDLTVVHIQEVEIGRDNPFTPYSQSSSTTSSVTTTTTANTTTTAKTATTTTKTTTKTAKTTTGGTTTKTTTK